MTYGEREREFRANVCMIYLVDLRWMLGINKDPSIHHIIHKIPKTAQASISV